MADRDLKTMSASVECPEFEETAFTRPPPLDQATVAIVTSAALHHAEQDDFTPTDTGFRVLDGSRRDVQLGHWSPNFDASGFAVDINVVYPVDRLAELVDSGRIGRVSDRHISFAGNQFELSGITLESGPAAAEALRSDGVDVVLLTPV